MTIGKKIQKARKDHHLSRKDLASQVQISEQLIGYYEDDSYIPDVPMQVKLADALGLSLFYLRNERITNTRELNFVKEAMILMYDKGGDPALEKYEEELMQWL